MRWDFVSMHSLAGGLQSCLFGAFIPSFVCFCLFLGRMLSVSVRALRVSIARRGWSVGYMKKSSSCVVLMGIAGSEFILRNGG